MRVRPSLVSQKLERPRTLSPASPLASLAPYPIALGIAFFSPLLTSPCFRRSAVGSERWREAEVDVDAACSWFDCAGLEGWS